jgi:uncharacterized protein (TIRG00374 family)
VDNKKNSNIRRILIVAVIIIAITILFFSLVDTEVVVQHLLAADARYLFAASVALVLGFIAFAARWRALLGNKPPLLFTFHACNLGQAANILIPLRAGEPVRILVIGSEKSVSFTEATTSVVVERLFEQLMRLLALAMAILVGVGLDVSPVAALGGIGFLILGFAVIAWLVGHQDFTLNKGTRLLARLPRVTEKTAHKSISDLLQNLEAVSKPRRFLEILLWSVITWVLFWGFFYLTLLSLGTSFAPEQQLAVSLGAMALSPPSAPTQPGLFHASIVIPLAALGLNAEALTAYAVILHILEMLWIVGLAAWGLFATGSSVQDFFKANRGS